MNVYTSVIALGLALLSTNLTMALAQDLSAIENIHTNYMPGSYAPIPISKTYFNYQPKPKIQPVEIAPAENKAQPANDTQSAMIKPQRTETPMLSPDGSLVFPFGANLPNVICAPLHVCEVSLQPGETIQQIDVGDTLRWQVKLARSVRDGVETSHLIIKPSEVGIVSNLVAITDRRTYTIQLVSRKERSWMPKVAFAYPDDMQANWNAYFAQSQSNATVNLASNRQATSALDFKYRLKGDKPIWRPMRVYTDQVKTYIELPPAAKNEEIPALVLLGPGSTEQLVNYRLDGDRFIVDKVIHRASLISGVGRNQERVDIVKEGS
jgi:P-type conjugative transfer protein TrbG